MSAAAQFKAAVEAGDLEAGLSALAEDITFRSPVVYKPYEGREAVSALLRFVFEVFEDFRYVDEIADGDTHMLLFEARVGDKQLQGIDLLRENADGLIGDFTVMVRPMSGMHALAEAMRAKLEA